MRDINTGGPAFPSAPHIPGMNLRDYFAAKAMAEMNWVDKDSCAEDCYQIADAMLKAREK